MPGYPLHYGGDNYGNKVAKWLNEASLANYNSLVELTYEKGNTLDLVNTNVYFLSAYIDKNLYNGLDY